MFKVVASIRRRSSHLRTTLTDDGKRDRGAVFVEFAFILPIILLIIFVMIDIGRFLVVRMALTGAAEQGARAVAYGATTSTATNIIRGAMSTGVIRLSTLVSSSDTSSVVPSYWTCPANSETYSDATCLSYTDPNYATYSCTGASGSNYRAKASAYVDFKWLTPLDMLYTYLDPNVTQAGIADSNRDVFGITAYSKSICQN